MMVHAVFYNHILTGFEKYTYNKNKIYEFSDTVNRYVHIYKENEFL